MQVEASKKRIQTGVKNSFSGSPVITSKHSLVNNSTMSSGRSDSESGESMHMLVPAGSKWLLLGEQLAKINDNLLANKLGVKHEEAQEMMECAPVLREEDMDMYGVTPSSDSISLVICSHCDKTVLSSRFLSHTELCQSIKDLPADDSNKRKAPETISRPPKKPTHDGPAKPLSSPPPVSSEPRNKASPTTASSKSQQKAKPVRPTLLRTADGRFAPMNKLKKAKGKNNRKKAETPTPEELSDEGESNAPRTPEYDRDDDATVPSSDQPSTPDEPSPAPAASPPYYIPPPPPLPSPSRALLMAAGDSGPTPLATRTFARPNKLRRIIVSLVPSTLIQQKQQLCTIYREQPAGIRSAYSGYNSYTNTSIPTNTPTNPTSTTTPSLSSSTGITNPTPTTSNPTATTTNNGTSNGVYTPPYLNNGAQLKDEKSDVTYNVAGSNFPGKAAATTKKVVKKKPEQGAAPGTLTGPLNGQAKKKRKSEDGDSAGTASAEQSPAQSPILGQSQPIAPLSPSLGRSQGLSQSQNLGQSQPLQNPNLGQSQPLQNPNLGQSQNMGQPIVKIYKGNSTGTSNSVNLQIGPTTGPGQDITNTQPQPQQYQPQQVQQPGAKVAGGANSLKSFYKAVDPNNPGNVPTNHLNGSTPVATGAAPQGSVARKGAPTAQQTQAYQQPFQNPQQPQQMQTQPQTQLKQGNQYQQPQQQPQQQMLPQNQQFQQQQQQALLQQQQQQLPPHVITTQLQQAQLQAQQQTIQQPQPTQPQAQQQPATAQKKAPVRRKTSAQA